MEINRKSLSFEDLKIRKRKAEVLTRTTAHSIKAFDTETYKGYARLICDSDGRHILEPDADSMLSFMTSKNLRECHLFSYNLRFDAQALLKLLPNANIRQIADKKKTVYHDYLIKYIPKKLLTIRDENRHVVRMYDLAQYFETSLEKAAEKYLSERKIDFPYRETMNTDISVWNDYEDDIIKYCLQDANVTAKLGVFLDEKFYKLFKIKPQGYISKGSLGKFLVRHQAFIPDINKIPVQAISTAFYAYKGGRFEALMKGSFKYAELYDIVSAYPYEIANLIDCTAGKWKQVTDIHEDAYYGYYVCSATVPRQRLCPVAYVMPMHYLVYPFGQWHTYLTKQEIEAYRPYADIEVVSGWEYYPDKIYKPFHGYISRLFNEKKKLNKKDYAYDLVKKMMNSVYGAFYEKTKREGGIFTGILFNPVYASVICANTRIKLFLKAKEFEEDVISLATDSVLFKGHHTMQTSKELGEWDDDGKGQTVVIANGIYEMESKVKTRGMMNKAAGSGKKSMQTPYGEYDNIFEYMREQPELSCYRFYSEKPVQMAEAVKSTEKFKIEDINTWQKFEKSVYIGKDLKRLFYDEYHNGSDILNRSLDSGPLVIEEF